MVSNHQPIRAVVLRESPNSRENEKERRRGGGGPRRRVIGSYMESQLSHHQYTLCRITALIDRSPSTSPLPSPIYLAPPPFPALWLHSASRIPLNPTPHISSHLRKKTKKQKTLSFLFQNSCIYDSFSSQVSIRDRWCHCLFSLCVYFWLD